LCRTLIVWLFLIFFYCLNSGPADLTEYRIFLFYLCNLPGAFLCLAPRTDILLPQGRKERFFTGISAVITAILVILVIGFAFIVFTKILSLIIPSVFFMGKTYEFVPLQFKFLFIPAVLLPAAGALLLPLQNKRFISSIALMGMAIVLLAINHFILSHGGYAFSLLNLFIIILAAAISWGAYIAVLYYSTMKTSFSVFRR